MEMPIIYHYNSDTGGYIGQGMADPSPVNPDTPIIPAFATTKAPPNEKDGYKAVFINGLWKLKKI